MSTELECVEVQVPGFWSTGIEQVPASTAISHAFASGAEGTVCQCRRVKIGPVPISHARWHLPVPTFAAVTSWNARRQHLVRDNAPDMLCARGTVVRPGEQHAGEDQSPMTQERIDAMPLCQACNASRRRIESESQP